MQAQNLPVVLVKAETCALVKGILSAAQGTKQQFLCMPLQNSSMGLGLIFFAPCEMHPKDYENPVLVS